MEPRRFPLSVLELPLDWTTAACFLLFSGLTFLAGMLVARRRFSSRAPQHAENAELQSASSLQELRESEHRWRVLAEALPHLVWTATADGTVDYLGAQATAYLGGDEQGLLGQGWLDAFHPDDRQHTSESWLEAIREQRPHEVQHRIRRADGQYRWFTSRGVRALDSTGRVFKWFGTSTDITELKELQEDLRRSKDLLEHAVGGSKVGIFDFDMPDGNLENSHQTMINVWERMGLEPSEFPPDFLSGATLAVHPDDLEHVLNAIQSYLNGPNEQFEVEYRVVHKNGAVLWHIARGTAIRDPDGKPIRFMGIFFDANDMKAAEERLRDSEQRWRSLAEMLPQFVWTTGPDGMVDYFSAKTTEYTGVPESELIGMGWLDAVHPVDLGSTVKI